MDGTTKIFPTLHTFIIFIIPLLIHLSSCNADSTTPTKISQTPIWNATNTDKLRHDLLLNYDKFARPTQHYNTTVVKFGMTITHIAVSEFKSTLTVHSWTKLVWTDDKLHWNPANYGDLDVIHLAEHEFWQPDICLYNSATATPVSSFGNTHCLLYSNGEILWVPPTQYSVLCDFNLKYWPFDTQTCKLVFGSWTYHGEQIDFTLSSNMPVDTDLLVSNIEWEILDVNAERHSKYYNCCSEAYPDVTVNLTIRRRSSSYRALIITPAFAIIMLTLMNFWLPPQAGEKIILNGCNAIIITLFLLYFSQKLPVVGANTPLIVLFFSSSLYIACFTMATSIVVIVLSRTKHSKPLPWIVKQPLVGKFGKWLCLNPNMAQSGLNSRRSTAEEMRDHQVTEFEESTNEDHHIIGNSLSSSSVQQDWLLLAAAIDRISFIAYALLFGILAIAYHL